MVTGKTSAVPRRDVARPGTTVTASSEATTPGHGGGSFSGTGAAVACRTASSATTVVGNMMTRLLLGLLQGASPAPSHGAFGPLGNTSHGRCVTYPPSRSPSVGGSP